MKFIFLFRAVIAGGGAPEIEIALKLADYAQTVTGVEAYCFRYLLWNFDLSTSVAISQVHLILLLTLYRAFAQAMEVIPNTLAENAGLNPIQTVTELRNRHAAGEATSGINVRKVEKIISCFELPKL